MSRHKKHHQHTDGMRMPAWIRRWVYAAGSACFLTGALWLSFHYFVRHDGEFGPEAHPLEHVWLTLHGGAAIAMAWVFGLMWMAHVRRGWQKGRNLKSGITMVSIMLILIFSGWGLYYLSDEQWRNYAGLVHWCLGLFAGLWLPVHILRGRLSLKKLS